jgi:hypothetical protein
MNANPLKELQGCKYILYIILAIYDIIMIFFGILMWVNTEKVREKLEKNINEFN